MKANGSGANLRIAVFGLGYVGSVTAACLAAEGHEVVGVDPNQEKVDLISRGETPVFEPGLGELIAEQVEQGRLSAVTDADAAVSMTEVALICVGTPSQDDGALDLQFVKSAAHNIGDALKSKQDSYSVVLRSTVLPGTTRNVLIPILEESSGRRFPDDFSVAFNPEFLREGVSIEDYHNPPKIVAGTESGKPDEIIETLYNGIPGERFTTEFEVAELAKYVDNAWHATKVVFANEIGRIAKSIDADGREVMKIMTSDLKLNLSARYLRPGFAYGGSCLPKDVAALIHFADEMDIELPTIRSLPSSNDSHVDAAVEVVESMQRRRIGMLGLTFKPGTDDMRNSPYITLLNRLLDNGYEVRVADPAVRFEHLLGANLEYLRTHIPGIDEIFVPDPEDVVLWSEVVIVGKDEGDLLDCLEKVEPEQGVIDLVGVSRPVNGQYVGLVW